MLFVLSEVKGWQELELQDKEISANDAEAPQSSPHSTVAPPADDAPSTQSGGRLPNSKQ